jgi:arylsulfatase A-like enzyme
MGTPFSRHPPHQQGRWSLKRTGFAFALTLVLLAWLPVLSHDLAGQEFVLMAPATARAVALLSTIWLGIGVAAAGLAALLGAGSRLPGLAAGIGLGGSALTLIVRSPVQAKLSETPLPTELGGLLLVLGATAVAGIALRGLCLVLPERSRSALPFVASALGLLVVATGLWQVFQDIDTVHFGLPILSASIVLLLALRIEFRTRWLALLTALVTLVSVISVFPGHEVSAALSVPRGRSADGATNVVVFMVDSLRADHTGVGGYGLDTTPVLDAAAFRRGTVFARAIAPASFTQPSVAALLTSHLAHPEERAPEPAAWTMAEAFRQAGRETGAFSANHVISGEGFRQGFGTFFAGSILTFMRSTFLFRELVAAGQRLEVFRLVEQLDAYKIPGRQLVSAALRWIDDLEGRPFFAYVHLIEPHWPYHDRGNDLIPPEVRDLEDPITLDELVQIEARDPSRMARQRSPRLRELMGRYDDEIRHADRALGDLLAGLRSRGLDRRTLVIVVGDHGEEFFDRGGLGHAKGVEEFMIHVPLVFLWPQEPGFGDLPPRIEQAVSLLDVFPTLADYLELTTPPASALGRSLRPLLEGKADAVPRPVVAESWKGTVLASTYREGDVKVRVVYPDRDRRIEEGRLEIFELDRDPDELRPLAPGNQHAALAGRARRRLDELWARRQQAETGSLADQPADRGEDGVVERLRGLGYVD